MLFLTDADQRRIEQIAKDQRVVCQQCGSNQLDSDGTLQRHLGGVRIRFICANRDDEAHRLGYTVEWTISEAGARQLGIPIPPFRRPGPPA